MFAGSLLGKITQNQLWCTHVVPASLTDGIKHRNCCSFCCTIRNTQFPQPIDITKYFPVKNFQLRTSYPPATIHTHLLMSLYLLAIFIILSEWRITPRT